MVKGSLQEKHGTYYVVVSYRDSYDKPRTKWVSTGIRKDTKQKAKAREIMKSILEEFDEKAESITEDNASKDILFTDFLNAYLPLKKQEIEPITYNSYSKCVKVIVKYFKNMRLKLKDVKPFHIAGFYKTLYDKKLSGSTILHYHIVIRESLSYAFKNDMIDVNVADKLTRPKKEIYKATFYSVEEIQKLFEAIKYNELKLPIMLAAMYGLRRSEVLGLKWNAIDFENKLIKIQHKVIETEIEGKTKLYQSDKMKTESSNRVLPLLPQAEELLKEQLDKIERNKKYLSKCYPKRFEEYVCVDNSGWLIYPTRLTHNFNEILKKNKLRHIRFHDLRHTCASLMLQNNVPLKQIQEWLGHADFATTANIYSHLDYSSKINSANVISTIFSFSPQNNNQKEKIKNQNQSGKPDNDRIKELEELLALIQKENQERERKMQQEIDDLNEELNSKDEEDFEKFQEWLKTQRKKKRQIEM